MDQLLGDAVQLDRFAMLLITLFAVGGLVTAAGGVYALLAYTVMQRRREIALRMALGASPRRVARSIVMESLVLAVAGGTIGLVGAAASSRYSAGTPTKVFDTRYYTGAPGRTYDISPDGQRFLMIKASGTEPAPSMVVVLNWLEELKAKLPEK